MPRRYRMKSPTCSATLPVIRMENSAVPIAPSVLPNRKVSPPITWLRSCAVPVKAAAVPM